MEIAEEGYIGNIGIMVEDSYWSLLNSYGWKLTDNHNGGHGPTNWMDETIEYNGTNNPFYFMRTGMFLPSSGAYRSGYSAHLWSKSPSIIKHADRPTQPVAIVFVIFDDIGPSRVDNSLSNSLSLRCLTQ